MSWFSKLLGLDVQAPVQTPGFTSLLKNAQDPNAGMDALTQQTTSLYNNALPGFMQQMQGQKEDNIRRGISTGDLGTSFEGDLTSAFQRNLTSAIAGNAASMYNSNQDRLTGLVENQQDAQQSAQNNAQQRRAGLFGGLLGAAGSALGYRGGH